MWISKAKLEALEGRLANLERFLNASDHWNLPTYQDIMYEFMRTHELEPAKKRIWRVKNG